MEEKKTSNQFNPVYAIDLIKKEDSQKKWSEQKKKLPRNVRYGLINSKTEELIKALGEKYQLNSAEKVGGLSSLIENFMAGELNEELLKKEVFQRFQFNVSLMTNFLADFKKIIEEINKIGIKAVKEDLVVLSFKELLEKFPEIKQQEIGVQLIFFPKEEERKKPTIENWIIDYRLRKTEQQKTAILNVSDYLYNSKNTQELDAEEKDELSIILKAFENNGITYYNTLFERIDFEIIKLLDKNKKSKSKFKITKMESKPYHESDKNMVFKKPKPVVKIVSPKIEKTEKQANVLDLNNYV